MQPATVWDTACSSLVRQADAGAGEPRLVMLEAIREYAAERLDDTPEFGAAARRAHAAARRAHAASTWVPGAMLR